MRGAVMTHEFNPARRAVLQSTALAAVGFTLLRGSGPAHAAATTSATPLQELGYAQVQLGPRPLDRLARENHRLLLGLDENALLRPFRLRAGLAAPGQELGDCYDTWRFAPGATIGQWLSALARICAITGDEPPRAKIGRLVHGYAATIDANGAL